MVDTQRGFAGRCPQFLLQEGLFAGIALAAASLSLLYSACAYLFYIAQYFFLFDDYFLLHAANNNSLGSLFAGSFIGFYRPLAFAVLKLENLLFSWKYPGLYLSVSVLIHTLNSGLVFILASRWLRSYRVARLAGILFFCAPWASEAFFWMSSQFDLLATFFALVSLTCAALIDNQSSPGKYLACLSGLLASSFLAYLSKESSLVLPLLAAASYLMTQKRDAQVPARILAVIAAPSLTAVIFLLMRSRVLDLFNSSYGSYFDLMRHFQWIHIVNPFVFLPLGSGTPDGLARVLFYAFSGILILVAFRAFPLKALCLVLMSAAALAPVLWYEFYPYSSAGGRLLYLPSVFLCTFLCLPCAFRLHAAKDGLLRHYARFRSVLIAAAFVYFMSFTLVSIHYQQSIWQVSSQLARQCIRTFDRLHIRNSNKADHYYVDGLPYMFTQGPYVLKAYAFKYYFDKPNILLKARAETLSYQNGEVSKVNSFLDPTSDEIDMEKAIHIPIR
jgi:hypothetical protein